MCGGSCRDAAVVLTQILLCGQAGLFQTVSWGDRHSPEGWEALEAVLGGRGLMFVVFHVVENQSSGWPSARLSSPAGRV